MAGAADYQLREYLLSAYTSSVGGTPVAAYVPVPYDGVIYASHVTPSGTITAADSTTTVAVLPQGVAASAVNVGTTLVIPSSGAAAGTRHTTIHTGARNVRRGDVIRLTPAGASTVVPGTYVVEIRR
jgi:hypothetical protein